MSEPKEQKVSLPELDMDEKALELFIATRLEIAKEFGISEGQRISTLALSGIDAEAHKRIQKNLLAALARIAELEQPQPREQTFEDGASLIAAERNRQVRIEGWSPEHDDEHARGEMAMAARNYAYRAVNIVLGLVDVNDDFIGVPGGWPWDREWWKPSPDPIRNLVKAGALIAAEIDRLKRNAAKEQK
jgi:hypothetical protein